MSDELFKAQQKAILDGDKVKAMELAKKAVDSGIDLLESIEQGFGAGIRAVGELWEAGDYFLPELVQGAEAMKAAMSVLQPALRERMQSRESEGTVVIGTVQGDIHDIGKTLVGTFLEANGFKVIDLGRDVPMERFIEEAEQNSADIICLSALLTTTMTQQQRLVELLEQKGLKGKIAVLVGGAPVTPDYAFSIGADGYGANAMDALQTAMRIMEAR